MQTLTLQKTSMQMLVLLVLLSFFSPFNDGYPK
jgi:hypothetical protein